MNCHCCKKGICKTNLTGLCMQCKNNKLIFIRYSDAIKKYPIDPTDLLKSKLICFKNKCETYYYLKDIQNLADDSTKNLDNKDPSIFTSQMVTILC